MSDIGMSDTGVRGKASGPAATASPRGDVLHSGAGQHGVYGHASLAAQLEPAAGSAVTRPDGLIAQALQSEHPLPPLPLTVRVAAWVGINLLFWGGLGLGVRWLMS